VTLRIIADLILLAWAVPAILSLVEFVLVRGVDGRPGGFREAPLGWLLLAHMGAVATLAVLSIIGMFVDRHGPVWVVLRTVAFLGLIVATWWWWTVIHRARIASRVTPLAEQEPGA
jgi:hypothetical protein